MNSPSTPKGKNTQAAILESANELFLRQGYHGTSMRQIARDAGIALGGIYNHFSSKEAIFEAVFLANHPVLQMIPAIEAAEGETVDDFVRDAAKQMIAAIYERPYFLNLMFIEIVEFKSAHTHQLFQSSFPRGVQIVQRMIHGKDKVRDIPAPMLIRAFISLFFSYYLADVIIGEIAPQEFRDHAMEYYVDIFLHGILEGKGIGDEGIRDKEEGLRE
jgi:AcrR family transcriptional regulator